MSSQPSLCFPLAQSTAGASQGWVEAPLPILPSWVSCGLALSQLHLKQLLPEKVLREKYLLLMWVVTEMCLGFPLFFELVFLNLPQRDFCPHCSAETVAGSQAMSPLY